MQQTNGETERGIAPIAAQRYLQRDPLRHILHLKMLAYHGHLVKTVHIVEGSAEGVLLQFPTTALSYDHQKYGDYELVAMPAADTRRVSGQLLDYVPKTAVVFKLIHGGDEALIARRFESTRVRVFSNYTSAGSVEFSPDPDIIINTQLNNELVEAFGRNGHTPVELARFIKDGGKALSVKKDGRTVSAGLIYPNFGNIWEVAALFTEPSARRSGYSIRIVRTALHHLLKYGYTPRFVVDEVNTPSISLAQAVGLEHFLNVIHCTAS